MKDGRKMEITRIICRQKVCEEIISVNSRKKKHNFWKRREGNK
jgi:hypothetical protein